MYLLLISPIRFTLFQEVVQVSIVVTIIQNVPPEFKFTNLGEAIFKSLPDDNLLMLLPLICTNETFGNVTINPVVLNPWIIEHSNVESTITETPANPSYVTIGERFNMSIRACMPESVTGIALNVTLPHSGSTLYVTLNDAYVTFIGPDVQNTIIFEGDSEFLTAICVLSKVNLYFCRPDIF